MGAHNFTDEGIGRTAWDAYEAAVRAADAEYGCNAYNGTISTTRGFVEFKKPAKVRHAKWMRETIQRELDSENSKVRKWGPCGCIEMPREKGMPRGYRRYVFFGWAAS